jgi:hypothetical protein
MTRITLIGIGLWMIGDGVLSWPTIGGVTKVVGGALVLLAALGVDF